MIHPYQHKKEGRSVVGVLIAFVVVYLAGVVLGMSSARAESYAVCPTVWTNGEQCTTWRFATYTPGGQAPSPTAHYFVISINAPITPSNIMYQPMATYNGTAMHYRCPTDVDFSAASQVCPGGGEVWVHTTIIGPSGCPTGQHLDAGNVCVPDVSPSSMMGQFENVVLQDLVFALCLGLSGFLGVAVGVKL